MPYLSWLWSSVDTTDESTLPGERSDRAEEAISHLETITTATSLPPSLLLLSFFLLGSVSTGAAFYTYARFFRRISNAEWVTPAMLAKKRWIKGYVTSVGDADNFRLYHTPGIGWRWPLKFRRIPTGRELKDQTIHIRLAGVDAPEAGHFGRPAQAFAEESLAWLKKTIEGRTLYCQLLRRDQYGRVVAHPHLPPRFLPAFLFTGRCIPLEMLKAGWVTVYEQAGAEYGHGGKEGYLRIQAEAQAARRGIWQFGTLGETPAEYKRRHAAAATGNGTTTSPSNANGSAKAGAADLGIFRHLLRWARRK